ncbi:MBL fold metallo-hydrolase [Hirschia litorea]|uniref:MBL fold metallo-hydrolase n=1 Tax=Hirschia litorea TaxID=1199156 RepID=A0ABW2IIW1_9PROT
MAGIPFVSEIKFDYEEVAQVSPLIQRVIANNPGAFTYTGTGVYIVGDKECVVFDPGPHTETHFEALKKALEGRTVKYVLVTHSHMDHSPLAHPLAEWAGCEVYAGGPAIPSDSDVRMEAGDDLSFQPHHTLTDGQLFSGDGWTVEAVATPGHTSNHYCFALKEENALFSGDHIMGWSTTVISPPDGNMGDYFDSLEKVKQRGYATIWPTHGPPVTEAGPFIAAYISHRRKREQAIVDRLQAGDTLIPEMVKTIYKDVDKRLHPAACHSVMAHMIHLVDTGRAIASTDTCSLRTEYKLGTVSA